MRTLFYIFLTLTLFSCNSKYNEYNEFDDMYNILCQDFDSEIEYLIKKNEQKLNLLTRDSLKSKKASEFHKLITDYTNYIFELELILFDATESPFFTNDSISELGLEYLAKNNFYREQFLNSVIKEDFKNHIRDKFRDRSLQNRDGEMIEHMEYYFYEIRKSGTAAYLKNKKRIAHEIESEYLTNLITN
jgi:hypothetical protein